LIIPYKSIVNVDLVDCMFLLLKVSG